MNAVTAEQQTRIMTMKTVQDAGIVAPMRGETGHALAASVYAVPGQISAAATAWI